LFERIDQACSLDMVKGCCQRRSPWIGRPRRTSKAHPVVVRNTDEVIGRITRLRLYGPPERWVHCDVPITYGQKVALQMLPKTQRAAELRRMMAEHEAMKAAAAPAAPKAMMKAMDAKAKNSAGHEEVKTH